VKIDNNQYGRYFHLISMIIVITLLNCVFVSIPKAHCTKGNTVALWHLDEVQPVDYMEITPDSLGFNNGTLGGEDHPTLVEGKFGKAFAPSGQDTWVEIYRAPELDLDKQALTLSLWVKPKIWNGLESYITKGDWQFGLRQSDPDSLEFYLTTSSRVSLKVPVPSDWIDRWHHLMVTYDGKYMRLFVDEIEMGQKKQTGKIVNAPFPINLCRNWETDDQNFTGKMSNALMDRVTLFDRSLTPAEVDKSKPKDAIIWLDFESVHKKDDFYSYGIGGRTYGLIWADRNVQPELFQVKKSAQPVEVSPVDLSLGKIKIKNWHHFTNLKELRTSWEITSDKQTIESGKLELDISPQESSVVTIPFTYPKKGIPHYLTLSWTIPENTSWADAGHEIAFAQYEIPIEKIQKSLISTSKKPLELSRLGEDVRISGDNFTYIFSRSTGTLTSILFAGKEILKSGPKMNVWRAPLANDLDGWTFDRARVIEPHPALSNFAANGFWAAGLDRLQHHVDKFEVIEQPDKIVIQIQTHASAKNNPTAFQNRYAYEIRSTGDIILTHTVTPEGKMPNYLPKMGLQMELDESFRNWTWKGRGPFETYPDRKTGARFGVWETTVDEAYVPYLIPQDHANRTDVSWSVHTNGELGLFVQFDKPLNVSLQKWETENLSRALLIPQLKSFDGLTLNIDPQVSGVGCTAVSILNKYRVFPTEVTYAVRFLPFDVKETDPVDLSFEPWQ